MIHPYPETYLEAFQRNLAVVFDLALRQEGMESEEFSRLFAGSEVAGFIERGSRRISPDVPGTSSCQRYSEGTSS